MTQTEISSGAIFEAIREPFEAALNLHILRSQRKTISLDPYAMVPLETYAELAVGYAEHVERWLELGVDIKPIVKSVLLVDTATEANLPWYTAHIEEGFEPWHEWNARWTAEERSHEEVMLRDIEARGIFNMSTEWLPVREQNMAAGIHPEVTTPADGIAYVATQELLTKIAHFHSSRIMDEKGARNLRAVGSDEGRHYKFYVDMLKALGEAYPDFALIGMRRQHEGDSFAMPGQKGIRGYNIHAKNIALSGIFDSITVLEAQKQTIDDAGLLRLKPITADGMQAQEWASGLSEKTDLIWDRKSRLMDRIRERSANRANRIGPRPFILGHTVELVNNLFVPITI